MRTSTQFLLALTSVLLAAPACDVEEDLDIDDQDEPTAFRCGTPCLNSPYLGAWDITNQSIGANTPVTSPDGTLTTQWGNGLRDGWPISGSITLNAQGAATVEISPSNAVVPITNSKFYLGITEGGVQHVGRIWFAGATTTQGDEDPTFTITRYDIRTDVNPGPDHTNFGKHNNEGPDWYSVCPITQGGTNKAVLLAMTHADQVGDSGSVREHTREFAIACDGHAMSKGVTQLNVIPRPGTARSYGYGPYSSLIQGWQAIFHGDSHTYLGAAVGVVDTANNPPLFNTLDPITLPTPIVGQYEWILESVYKDTGAGNRGAQCKFTSHPLRSDGDHRNSWYDWPVATVNGWASLPECAGALNQYGHVAFYSVSHMVYQLGDQGGGSPF